MVLVGKIDEVWKEAQEIETKRRTIRIRKRERERKKGVEWKSPIIEPTAKTLEKRTFNAKHKKKENRSASEPPLSETKQTSENPLLNYNNIRINRECKMETEEDEDEEHISQEEEHESISFFDLKIKPQPKNLRKAWLAAKKLVNLGELSKAMAQFKTIGVAPMTPLIQREVSLKFEKAAITPKWPTIKRVRQLRKSGRSGLQM